MALSQRPPDRRRDANTDSGIHRQDAITAHSPNSTIAPKPSVDREAAEADRNRSLVDPVDERNPGRSDGPGPTSIGEKRTFSVSLQLGEVSCSQTPASASRTSVVSVAIRGACRRPATASVRALGDAKTIST